jgi:hypothetical protein
MCNNKGVNHFIEKALKHYGGIYDRHAKFSHKPTERKCQRELNNSVNPEDNSS